MEQTDKMSSVIEKLKDKIDESVIEDQEDCKGNDQKEEVRRDVFTTEEEAVDRAKEIGCVGFHTHDEDGQKVFMVLHLLILKFLILVFLKMYRI